LEVQWLMDLYSKIGYKSIAIEAKQGMS